MGASGSGRRGGGRCTDDMYRLDIRAIKRSGLLDDGRLFTWAWRCNGERVASVGLWIDADAARLTCTWGRAASAGVAPQPESQWVGLTSTACALGGQRSWWVCPTHGCGRRVAILYGMHRVFACRRCQRLAYRSQRETVTNLAIRRAEKLRRRLGWEPGFLNDQGGKPKGMHWRTYWRLFRQYVDVQGVALEAFSATVGMLNRRIEGLQRSVSTIRTGTRRGVAAQ
jgi:hypothetical protein